jgi:hypothetical protein
LNFTSESKGDYPGVKLVCFVVEVRIQAELMAILDRNTHKAGEEM